MNDRFRYRVWDEEQKKYITGLNFYGYIRGMLNPERYTLEQCMGLKDRKGKFIFEGDWVKDKYGGYGLIVWSDCGFQVKYPGMESENLEFYSFYETAKVVGNIHENPTPWERKSLRRIWND